ncbi:MAG: hypothetical protein ABI417_03125 [Coleofasciculaceae cyanobacterium]
MPLNNLNNLPSSVKILIRPMLYLSLGLHGLLLMIPISVEPEAKSSSKKKESVKITQLPSQPSVKLTPVVPLPKPSPTVKQNPAQVPPPQAKTPPARLNPIIESPKPTPIIEQNTPTNAPTPIASLTPAPTPTLTPIASLAPIASPTPTPTPIASPTPTPNELIAGVPNFENAQQSCNGACWEVKQTSFRRVSTTLIEQFEAQGYAVNKQDIEDDAGRSVYTISKDGETKYLNVLSTNNGDAVYLLAETQLTRKELIQKTALSVSKL